MSRVILFIHISMYLRVHINVECFIGTKHINRFKEWKKCKETELPTWNEM